MKTSFKFLAALLLITTFSFAQDITKRIDSIIQVNYQKNPNVGMSIAFVKDNKEYFTAQGKLNAKSKTQIDKNSVFEIASITKIVTSNFIAQAVLEKKISIDDYIDNFLPKQYVLQDNLKKKIRISDLASHQSGLPDIDFAKLIALNPQQPISNVTSETLANLVNNCSELKDYGKYRYSTIGYTLLGQILEKVYNKSYDQIVEEKMIQPLKLKNTFTKNFDVPNITDGQSPDGTSQQFMEWNVTAPAGLIKSSASDIAAYLKAVLDKESTIGKAALLTEKTFYKVDNRELGLGVNIMRDDKNTVYLKSGDSMGQSCIIAYDRAKNWGIIILLNQRNSKLRQNMLDEIYDTVLK